MDEKEIVEIKAVRETKYDYKQLAVAIARFIVPVLLAILTAVGISVDVDLLTTILTAVLTFVAFAWSWWKDNNVTTAAQIANDVQHALKAEMREGEDD